MSTLSKSEHRVFKECHFSVLVRRAENAEALAKKGLKPVLFEGLENTDQVEKISRQYDSMKLIKVWGRKTLQLTTDSHYQYYSRV